jgi:hypothetical protein
MKQKKQNNKTNKQNKQTKETQKQQNNGRSNVRAPKDQRRRTTRRNAFAMWWSF